VLVLAYGAEPWLERSVASVLSSRRVSAEVVLVDNGADPLVVGRLAGMQGVRLVQPGRNTGFAGGCNLAASHANGEVLVLLNDDAEVEPDALHHLLRRLDDDGVGAVCASVRLAEDRALVNTVGNPLHYTGLSWAGGHGEPAELHRLWRGGARASSPTTRMRS
jgi:GT2 family glycosyltransferase